MQPFADIALVRLKLQLTEDTATDALISDCLAAAHRRIVPRLRPGVDPETHAEVLAAGEALLAGACVMRRLAASRALQNRSVTIAGQRLDNAADPGALSCAARAVEDGAWRVLAPLLAPPPVAPDMMCSPSRPVLGGEDRP